MVKRILAQLESLAREFQVKKIKKRYSDQKGIKIGQGFLWQHPGRSRQIILERLENRLKSLDKGV